jgi:protein TonB
MKNKPVISKSETIEDMVFEGRNRSYGAYELNRKHRKYLVFAFFISLMGVSTAIAVPFIKAFNGAGSNTHLTRDVSIEIIDVPKDADALPPPPPPPLPPVKILNQAVFAIPEIVEEAPEVDFMSVGQLIDNTINKPIDIIPVPVDNHTPEIEEPETEPILFPEEPATFMDGGLNEFSNWVQKNVVYPSMAVENQAFGKVLIEFCVNARGEVVNVTVLRSADPYLDNEAIRVISSSPKWTAPKQGGRPVKQRFVIPVIFRLQ